MSVHDQKLKVRIKDSLPEIRSNFLYASLILGLIIMVILCLPNLQKFTLPRTPLWNKITKYPLDAGLIQLISALLLAWVIYKYPLKIFAKKSFTAISSVLFVFLIMLVEIVMEKWLFKPSLRYDRLLDSLSEAFFTQFVLTILHMVGEKGTAAPSGFALRQMFLVLPFLILSQQEKWKSVFSTKATFVLYFLNILFFILVPLLRIYRGRHTLFDVGISIGIGTFIFWFFIIIIQSLVKKREAGYLEDLTGFSLIYIFSILFYCHNTTYWLLFSFLVILFLGTVYFFTHKIKNQHILNEKIGGQH